MTRLSYLEKIVTTALKGGERMKTTSDEAEDKSAELEHNERHSLYSLRVSGEDCELISVIDLRPCPGETTCYKGDCPGDYPPG